MTSLSYFVLRSLLASTYLSCDSSEDDVERIEGALRSSEATGRDRFGRSQEDVSHLGSSSGI